MRCRSTVQAAAMALLLAAALPGGADPAAAAAPADARVIVVLKSDAPLLREQPMGLRASARSAAATAAGKGPRP